MKIQNKNIVIYYHSISNQINIIARALYFRFSTKKIQIMITSHFDWIRKKYCILVEFTNVTAKNNFHRKMFKAVVFVFTLLTQTDRKYFWERRHMLCINRFNFSFKTF